MVTAIEKPSWHLGDRGLRSTGPAPSCPGCICGLQPRLQDHQQLRCHAHWQYCRCEDGMILSILRRWRRIRVSFWSLMGFF